MNPFTIIVILFLGALVGFRADKLGRNVLIWMICSIIFSPLLAWIALEIAGKTDEKREEEKKLNPQVESAQENILEQEIKNQKDEDYTEIVTPNGNVFKFATSSEENAEQQNDKAEQQTKNQPVQKIDGTIEAPEDIESKIPISNEVKEKKNEPSVQTIETLTEDRKTFFTKKEVIISGNLGLPQKIIFSVAGFTVPLIICYAFAEAFTDNFVKISNTWFLWIVFILIQAWGQNKIWASSQIKFDFFYFSISGLLKS